MEGFELVGTGAVGVLTRASWERRGIQQKEKLGADGEVKAEFPQVPEQGLWEKQHDFRVIV